MRDVPTSPVGSDTCCCSGTPLANHSTMTGSAPYAAHAEAALDMHPVILSDMVGRTASRPSRAETARFFFTQALCLSFRRTLYDDCFC